MFDDISSYSYDIIHHLITVSLWFHSSAEGLGERVPQEVSGGGRSRDGEAGQEGGAGVADQRDPAHRLRTGSSAGVLHDQLLCSENCLYRSSSFAVSHTRLLL